MTWRVIHAAVMDGLRQLASESVHCVVTSPPYWGLRSYGVEGQLGMEPTPEAYVAALVTVFRALRRVLREDGTLWLNIGDSYSGSNKAMMADDYIVKSKRTARGSGRWGGGDNSISDLNPKNLIGIPWRVAFALQADGWWLRSDIIWSKPNPMPESVTDRPTRAHEYIFLLTKRAHYFYDYKAIKEPSSHPDSIDFSKEDKQFIRSARSSDKPRGHSRRHAGFNDRWDLMTREQQSELGRNKRDVWEVATQPFPGAHFAVYPTALIEPCIKAGCPVGGVVLDPFCGSGTTGIVAVRLARSFIGIELSEKYCEMARQRIATEAPIVNTLAIAESVGYSRIGRNTCATRI